MLSTLQTEFMWVATSDLRKFRQVSWSQVVEKTKRSSRVGSLDGKGRALIFQWLRRIGN